MDVFEIIALLVTLSAVFAYLNHRFIKMPMAIGIMLFSLVLSLGIIGISFVQPEIRTWAQQLLDKIDFNLVLMNGMLSFLLFAGALHVNLNDLAEQKSVVGSLATVGVVLSTAVIGGAMHFVCGQLGLDIPLIYCLLFGALISPTDPIAVLSVLKSANAPKTLETKIGGESLFNDGIGVVVFLIILELAVEPGAHLDFGHVVHLLVMEAGGGIVAGLLLGWIGYRMLHSVDHYTVEVLITLALVCGGYALTMSMHMSGPIAVVVAGLFIGNHGRRLAMSEKTREHLDTFWELVDEILNAVLFVLIGIEILIINFEIKLFFAGLLAIPIALVSRYMSVGLAITILKRFRTFTPGVVNILTWGGVRGGISVALALSIPKTIEGEPNPYRAMLLTITYIVVIFSIAVQGLTIKKLLPKSSEVPSH